MTFFEHVSTYYVCICIGNISISTYYIPFSLLAFFVMLRISLLTVCTGS